MDNAATTTDPHTPEGAAAPPLHSPELGSPADEAPDEPGATTEEQEGWRQGWLIRELFPGE